MPDADRPTLVMAAVRLVDQRNIFVRRREQMAMPPVSLNLDDANVAAFNSYQRVGAGRTCAGERSRFAGLTVMPGTSAFQRS
jgi:hypothetical protein